MRSSEPSEKAHQRKFYTFSHFLGTCAEASSWPVAFSCSTTGRRVAARMDHEILIQKDPQLVCHPSSPRTHIRCLTMVMFPAVGMELRGGGLAGGCVSLGVGAATTTFMQIRPYRWWCPYRSVRCVFEPERGPGKESKKK